MQALRAEECAHVAKGLLTARGGFAPAWPAFARKSVAFGYTSRLANAEDVGAVLAAVFPTSDRVLFWTHGLVWGDRTRDPTASADWRAYGDWRAKRGISQSLHERPGLLFAPGESDLLASAIAWTLLTGSEALAIDNRRHSAIQLSHDDCVILRLRTRLPKLGAALIKLGLRRLSSIPGE